MRWYSLKLGTISCIYKYVSYMGAWLLLYSLVYQSWYLFSVNLLQRHAQKASNYAQILCCKISVHSPSQENAACILLCAAVTPNYSFISRSHVNFATSARYFELYISHTRVSLAAVENLAWNSHVRDVKCRGNYFPMWVS